jgi:acyl carrier protein
MNPTIRAADCRADDMTSAIAEAIRSVSARARAATIHAGSLLLEDLALDSLDLVAVVIQLQDQFQVEIDPDEIPSIQTVGDLAASLDRQLHAAA